MLLSACFSRWLVEAPVPERESAVSAERGRALLLNKSFLKVGVPLRLREAVFHPRFEPDDGPVMLGGRDRINDMFPTGYTGRMLGPEVAAATENCLLCHAGPLRGSWVLGLGNSFIDAQIPADDPLVDARALDALEPTKEEREVLEQWRSFQIGLLPYSRTTTPGTIAALYFTGYFFAHRSPDLQWVDEASYPMLSTPPPETDIPAWWLLKKKSCLYYGCEVKGDFTRSLMQFMAVPGNSAEDIKDAERDFSDVLAYLKTLEAPKYPGPIDDALAQAGHKLFSDACASCHGRYGERPIYPNKVVPLEKVGTDRARSDFMHELQFAKAYQAGWYGEHSTMEATNGYLAPPLDGVWATAPYLHNASVPTLDALLDPRLRPAYFVRSHDSTEYDLYRVGWSYEVSPHGQAEEADPVKRTFIFDTTLYGKSNAGHTFAARFSNAERRALLEYLKTL